MLHSLRRAIAKSPVVRMSSMANPNPQPVVATPRRVVGAAMAAATAAGAVYACAPTRNPETNAEAKADGRYMRRQLW